MRTFFQNPMVRAAALMLIMAVVTVLTFYARIEDRLIFSVDGYTLDKTEDLTVGKESDLDFHKVPKDYMSLSFSEDGETMSWEIDRSRDTLMYFKVNGGNPNIHTLTSDADIEVRLSDGTVILISKDEVDQCFRSHTGRSLGQIISGGGAPKYISLRHLICLVKGDEYEARVADESLRTFVYRAGKRAASRVCILDSKTFYGGKSYAYEGSVDKKEGMFSLQFFGMAENVYSKKNPDRTDVTVNGISYAVKPTVVTTEWTAGHMAFVPQVSDRGMSVEIRMPKGIMYAECMDALKKRSESTSGTVTVSQSGNAFPVFNNMYIPSFSSQIGRDLCSISAKRGKITVIDSQNDTTVMRSGSPFIPTLRRVDLKSDSGTIHARIGEADFGYWMSYLTFPLIIYLVLAVLAFYVFSDKGKISGMQLVNTTRLQSHATYQVMLLTILFVYLMCKAAIAIKLSYTYPYFEKISGISVTSGSMILIFCFTLSCLLNWPFLNLAPKSYGKKKGTRAYVALGMLAMCFALAVLSLYMMDSGNMNLLKSSYFPSETNFWNPFRWTESAGINDTHRSVCYTLFLFEAIALVIMTVLSLIPYDRIDSWIGKWNGMFKSNVAVSAPNLVMAFVMLLIVQLLPGNFATAFITIALVVGLSEIVIRFEDVCLKNIMICLAKIACIVVLLFLAMLPDQGYMVTFIGIFCAAFFCIPVLSYSVDDVGESASRFIKSTFVKYTVVVALGCLLLMLARPLIGYLLDPGEVSYGRFGRRLNMYSLYEKTKEAGFRYSESDMEFMAIMSHYMQSTETSDPLCNDEHFLHPSVATGQSPVVLNDVSVQSSFFGAYGWMAHLVFILMLAAMICTVYSYCFEDAYYNKDKTCGAFTMMRRRLLAMYIFVGSSVYLYLSYMGFLPYTGRLIPGFGVDSVGEALEICALFALMSQISIVNKEID